MDTGRRCGLRPLTGTNALTIESGRPFTGFFDGQGHSIRNFHMVCDNSTPNRAWGFFGALGPGAVVENLVFDASCSLAVKASKGTDCGILAEDLRRYRAQYRQQRPGCRLTARQATSA